MKSSKQVELLLHSVQDWNQKLKRKEISKINLANTNLCDAKLEGAYLKRADLSNANLTGASLLNTNLEEAFLVRAFLVRAELPGVNLCNANLGGANLEGANLEGVNLKGANLSNAYLKGADLSKADLSNAKLEGADLSKANLAEANLSRANLTSALLVGTDLTNSMLLEANLYRTNFAGAELPGANLIEASFGNTQVGDADLSKTLNLETINHVAPSDISLRAIAKSKGLIHKSFLKGVGLNDWEIETVKLYRASLSASQITNIVYKIDELKNDSPLILFPVFLSHSWADKEFTRHLFDALDKKGVRCWMDEKQLKPGDNILRSIDKGIKLYDKLILICSKDSLNSWWVERELERILKKEREYNHGKEEKDRVDLLVPITIDDYIFNRWNNSYKNEVDRYIIGDFQNCKPGDSKFNKAVDLLVEGLQVNRRELPPPSYLPPK